MKLYKVTFLEYTNSLNNCVKNEDEEYLNTSNPVIIKEEDINLISQYGKGIKNLEYVGELYSF